MGNGQSRPSSPSDPPHRPRRQSRISSSDTSTILIDPGINSTKAPHRPTIEQNMAFAELKESQEYNISGHKIVDDHS